ncbi:uracil-xanthine permease family protein [Methanoplanus endosymbiosus]|uniref:Uracil-xanthine permease family protein n=1 Tax=Methanoplanus endosymbiosus TaxID=33865 RepID=A0A9E7PJY2_9EURY|nr:uracil-xanthine permease family protein [Methanoplanus endosymbiosus]UUX91263.1 uracil-xanthine permease family protein [Methanoplanus endosymbiosus]
MTEINPVNIVKRGFQGLQILFVAFGALVLVPLLTGLDPNVALFTAGAGTLIFQLITKMKVPIFLASSFAFIPAITYGVATWGIPSTMCGLAAAGLFYVLLSVIITIFGVEVINRVFPPIVVGPVISVIGLSLAPVAVGMALGKSGDLQVIPVETALIVAGISLITTLAIFMFTKGWLRLVPILFGITTGYLASLWFGLVDFSSLGSAVWIGLPNFVFPEWNLAAILFIVPVAIAPAIEHFGDILAIGSVTGKNYLKDPGVNRTMLGDGVATFFASFVGGPPNTTYSEVTGAVALTKVFNPWIMTAAAIIAIIFSFIGKIGAFLQSIPGPVMGGVMILLFGLIASLGIDQLIKNRVDLSKQKNIVIISLILVTGIGGLFIPIGEFKLAGIGLAAIIGVILNLVLPEDVKSSEEANN